MDDAAALGRAVSRVKHRLLPLVVLMFVANYIDRVNIGFVRPHLEADLGIGPAAYGLGAGLFFIGYACFEVPSNMLLQRFGARVWLTRIMLTWGLVATAMAFVQGTASFYAARFLLGVAEAGFFPGIVFYFTQWLPAAERGKAMAVFLSGSAIASIVAGPISGALLQIDLLGLHGWQWMFAIEGLMSVVLCGVAWRVLDATPQDAGWLSADERAALVHAVETEHRQRSVTTVHVRTRDLLRDPQIVLFCALYFAITLTIYAVTFWLPSIIRRIGALSDLQVGLLNSVPWIISMGAMYGFAALAARWARPQRWTATALTLAAAGIFLSTTGGPLLAFGGICFAALGFKAASSLFWPIPQQYLDRRISAAVLALINSLGNLGGFAAPAAFGLLEQKTGSVVGGLYGLAAVSLAAAIAVGFARTHPVSVEAQTS